MGNSTDSSGAEAGKMRIPLHVTHGPDNWAVNRRYLKRFALCHELRSLVWTSRPKAVVMAPNYNEIEIPLWAILFRSLQSFDSALLLADRGYGVQALMLGRSLFEDMVIVHRQRQQPAVARTAFIDHLEHTREVMRETFAEYGLSVPPDLNDHPPLSVERRKALDAKFGRQGFRLWTGDKVGAMVISLEAELDEQDRPALRALYTDYLLSNRVLHNTPLALDQTITVGGSELLLAEALRLAYASFAGVAVGVVQGAIAEEITVSVRENTPEFRPIPHAVRAGIGRNDLCPCGSGKKFKRCHGDSQSMAFN